MKVLFISNLITDYSAYEPLGILYLAGALKKAGHQCHFCHARMEDITLEMEQFKPEILAFSAATGTHHDYLKLNRMVKEKYKILDTKLVK